jgi:tRNA A37 threonylcarbamoyladenosine biosynthesis protein TsaE
MSIWGDEIAKNSSNILLIEWPDILGNIISPTKEIDIEILGEEKRKITITFS